MIASPAVPIFFKAQPSIRASIRRHGEPATGELAGKVQALCASVEQLRHSIEAAQTPTPPAQPAEHYALETAKQALAVRRRRERMFGDGLFSEPVWDILLELYVARAESSDVPVGNACLAASVPMTSALRWCQLLLDRAVIYRERDPKDRRRVFLRITDDSFAKLTTLLSEGGRAALLPAAE